jgi:hypothetical protein
MVSVTAALADAWVGDCAGAWPRESRSESAKAASPLRASFTMIDPLYSSRCGRVECDHRRPPT